MRDADNAPHPWRPMPDRLDDLNQALSPDNPTAQRLLEALYDYGEQLA